MEAWELGVGGCVTIRWGLRPHTCCLSWGVFLVGEAFARCLLRLLGRGFGYLARGIGIGCRGLVGSFFFLGGLHTLGCCAPLGVALGGFWSLGSGVCMGEGESRHGGA